jgi:hypothetical protein
MTDLSTAWRPFEPSSDAPIDDESRCAVCGWTMEHFPGCVPGSCSLRPRPATLYAPERAAREADEVKAFRARLVARAKAAP